ncbi:MAG: efflux RND transporter periplasmic adaptor subunit [Candidatus Latescibacteria bacterium]|nr:efflux RND transporter periplasmic adaptor subunit [Candidatus Latescibacterota bacterium]
MTSTASADLSGLKIDREAPPPPSLLRRRGPILAVAAAIAILVLGALLIARVVNPPAVRVAVARAESLGGVPGTSATEILTANGYVVARQRASVSTEVAGRLKQLFVEEGSRVAQGEVLGVLQNADQESALESARAELAAAHARAAEAAASARESALMRNRAERLRSQGLVSQSEMDQAEARDDVARARVRSAEADVKNAEARLQAAQVAYDKTFIRAPFAGAVLRKEAEVGEIVSPIPSSGGLTRGAIVTMANLASLEGEVDVNEGYVARVREGMRAEITLDAYPSERFPGSVRQIVPTADRQKATVLVKVAFDRLDPRVLPEMGVKVTFLADAAPPGAGGGSGAGQAAPAVSIPKTAVRESDGRAVVYVVEGGRAAMRGVSPRPLTGDRVAVSGGIAPGELVIVEAPPTLADNVRVRVK